MPGDLRIVRGNEFIRLDAGGHFDAAETRRTLSDVLWACAQSKVAHVLLDVRDATSELSTAQLHGLTAVTREVAAPARGHRIAIVTRPEVQFDNVSLVADSFNEKGWNLRVFHDLDAAVRWVNG